MSDGLTVHVSDSKRRLIFEVLRARRSFLSKLLAGYDAVADSTVGQAVRHDLFISEMAELDELLAVFGPRSS